jgi:hypothetical protein
MRVRQLNEPHYCGWVAVKRMKFSPEVLLLKYDAGPLYRQLDFTSGCMTANLASLTATKNVQAF